MSRKYNKGRNKGQIKSIWIDKTLIGIIKNVKTRMRLSRIEDAIEWLLWEAVKFTGHSPAGGIVTQGMINDIYEQINILKDEVNLLKNESSIPKYKIEYLETMPYPDLLKIAFDLNLTNEKIARTEIIMRMMESDRIIVIVPEDFEEE